MNQKNLLQESALQGRGETVLVIEDDRALLRLYATMLVRANYRVLEALDVAEALRVWGRHGPEIGAVVADLHLGHGRNGYSLLQEFSAAKPRLAMILVSGQLSPELITTLHKTTRVQCLEKPAPRAAFLQKLRTGLDTQPQEAPSLAIRLTSDPDRSQRVPPLKVESPRELGQPRPGRQRTGAHRPPPPSRNRGHQGGG